MAAVLSLPFVLALVTEAQESPPASFFGIPCASAQRAEDGRLRSCELSADTEISEGVVLRKGTTVRFPAEGGFHAILNYPLTISGIPCEGSRAGGSSYSFHDDGRLRLCFLARDTELDGVPCMRGGLLAALRGMESPVRLHPDGRLAQCAASREFTRDGVTHRRGDRICLGTNGSVVACPK